MSESKNIHWAENEEVLEQFVLGLLDPTELAHLEKHLQDCGPCRILVANERELIAGIRLAGRESMKFRLAHRITQRQSPRASWYRVAGVAAGIVLLVTVGVYYRWFTGTETQVQKQDRADKTEKRLEPAPAASPERQIAKTERSSLNAAKPSRDGEHKGADVAAGAPKALGVESGKIAEAQADKLEDLKAVGVDGERERRGKKDRFAAAASTSTDGTIWVQGTVISEHDQNAPAPTEVAANAKDERSVLRKGKEQNLLAGKAANVEASEKVVHSFILTQKRLSELPPSQRAQQQRATLVQMLIQKSPAGTIMTVFLDSLLAQKDLDQSHVQTITEDSVILNLGNRLVGYKLPSGWIGQGMQQTKKQK